MTEVVRPSPTLWHRFMQLPSRNEILALVALIAAIQVLPRRVPLGIYSLGTVSGATLSLHAIALVLVYRSNGIINFSQVALGGLAAAIFGTLARYETLVHLVDPICPSDCVASPVASGIGYGLSLVLSIGLAVLLGWLSYVLVIQRWGDKPRLLLTAATIFLGYSFNTVGELIGGGFLIPSSFKEPGAKIPPPQAAKLPFDFVIDVPPTQLRSADVITLLVAVGAVVGLFLYLRLSAAGNAIRAASDSPGRAATLGIDVHGVTARVWIIAAGLSATVGVLGVMSIGASGGSEGANEVATAGAGPAHLARALAAVVLARLVSIPLAAVASVVLGVLEQGMVWSFASATPLDGSLFLIIGLLLLLQSGQMSRAQQAVLGTWRAAKEVRPIPVELRRLPVVRSWIRWSTVLGTVILLGLPWVNGPSQNSRLSTTMLYAVVGMSLLVLTGWAGQISLGQFGFAAIGAYVAAVSGLPFLLAVLLGASAGAATALVVGIPALRLKGLHLAMITLAFHQAVVAVGLNPTYLGRFLPARLSSPALFGVSFDDQRLFYYFCLLVLALTVFVVMGLRRTRTARALIATRDNEQAAQTFGINLTRARIGAFMTSGFLSALAGAILAYKENAVAASSFNLEVSQSIFLNTIVGGLGSVAGPLIGYLWYTLPLILGLLGIPAILGELLTGPGGLVILLVVPGGIGQVVYDLRDSLLRRVAKRNNIVVPSLMADVRTDGVDQAAVRIAPKLRQGGGQAFVPRRYGLARQWALDGVAVMHEDDALAKKEPVPTASGGGDGVS